LHVKSAVKAISKKFLISIMDVLGIIPSRYGSSRFPGKPLARISGMTMIEHVYRRASLALDNVVVATESDLIRKEVEHFGGKAVMTPNYCHNGTERCAVALDRLGLAPDVVVNIQGDEPFIDPDDIRKIIRLFDNAEVEIASLARRFDPADGFEALFSPDAVKVVIDSRMRALYFSRSIVPYVRDYPWQQWIEHCQFHIHAGLYGYRPRTLRAIATLPESMLETAERLEQLRWLDAGYRIHMALTGSRSFGIDTPADLERAIAMVQKTDDERRN